MNQIMHLDGPACQLTIKQQNAKRALLFSLNPKREIITTSLAYDLIEPLGKKDFIIIVLGRASGFLTLQFFINHISKSFNPVILPRAYKLL